MNKCFTYYYINLTFFKYILIYIYFTIINNNNEFKLVKVNFKNPISLPYKLSRDIIIIIRLHFNIHSLITMLITIWWQLNLKLIPLLSHLCHILLDIFIFIAFSNMEFTKMHNSLTYTSLQ